MTALGLPSQSAMQLAQSAAANAMAGGQNAGGAADPQDSSAFDTLLGSFDESGGQNPPASAPPSGDDSSSPTASWRSASAVHSPGSGVLIALDKRLDPDAPEGARQGSKKTNDDGVAADPGAAALANIGWASLLGGLAGAKAASTPSTSGSAPLSSAAALSAMASAHAAGKENAGAAIQPAMPSDSAATAVALPVIPAAASPPVQVKVTRAITYLGLDPTTHNFDSATGAAARPAAKTASATTSAQGVRSGAAPVAPPIVQSGSSDSASGDQRKPDSHGAGANGTAANAAGHADPSAPTDAGQATTTTMVSGAASTSSGFSIGALPATSIGQLADVVASAVEDLAAQAGQSTPASGAAIDAAAARTAPVKELDVQLNPASLGALSIQMRLSNGNLSVAIKADKADTVKLIENETSSISDKLKSLNFSLNSLTVKASDPAASSGATDASNTGTSANGEAQQGQSGQTADGSREGRLSQGDGGARQPARGNRQIASDAGGDGNFGHRVV